MTKLREQLQQLHDGIASIYTEDDSIKAAVIDMMDYLQSVLSQPDGDLEHYRQEVFARLQTKTELLENSDIAQAEIVNTIRRHAQALRPDARHGQG